MKSRPPVPGAQRRRGPMLSFGAIVGTIVWRYSLSMPHRMIHEILPVGMLQCNCSILGDPETREALVLDPGDEVERVLEALARHALTVRAIVSTHAHIDHVGGLRKLQQATGAPVMMHGDDLDLYRHLDVQAAFLGMRAPDPAAIDRFL